MRERRADSVEVDARALDPDAGAANATSLAALLGGGEPGEVGRRLSTDALRAIRTHLGMDVAFISEFVGDDRVFRVVDTEWPACPVQVGSGGPLKDSYCQRVVDGRLPELIHDAGAVPAAAELEVTSTEAAPPQRLGASVARAALAASSGRCVHAPHETTRIAIVVLAADHDAQQLPRHHDTEGGRAGRASPGSGTTTAVPTKGGTRVRRP